MREHRADAAAAKDVALGAEHREVRRVDVGHGVFTRLHVERADRHLAGLAGQPPAGVDGHRSTGIQADAPAEEEVRRVADAGIETRALAAGEREGPLSFEEEVALFRERTG